ncbi:MAG: kelch repeat-containing protein [Prolixibacteraceae bacterium]
MKRTLLNALLTGLALILCHCKEETIILPSPSIEISGVTNTGLSSFKLSVTIQKGEGQTIEEAALILEDATVPGGEALTFKIDLPSLQEQAVETNINTGQLNHDFIVEAVLKTDHYTYRSEKKMIRSPKNNYSPWFLTDNLYAIPDENIGLVMNPGDIFSIIVDYNRKFIPGELVVKLNDNYLTDASIDFNNGSYGSNGISSYGTVKVPKAVPPGIYSVDLYLDGHHFVFPARIKLLFGYWNGSLLQFSGEKRGDYSSFLINGKLYLVGGSFSNTALNFSPVWEYNFTTEAWNRKSNFPHPNPGNQSWLQDTEILPYRLQTGSTGYVLTRYSQKVELWKYATANDSWEKISDYPGTGEQHLVAFVLGDYLYAGGGTNYDPSSGTVTNPTEFFRINLNTLQWERKNDLPVTLAANYNLPVCTSGNKAYAVDPDRMFREYDAATDQWKQKTEFPGPWRDRSQMVSQGDDLYLIGGEINNSWSRPLKDFWKYSPGQDQWEQLAFLQNYLSRGIAFSYQNQIYAGLGYLPGGYDNGYPNQYLYRFVPEKME